MSDELDPTSNPNEEDLVGAFSWKPLGPLGPPSNAFESHEPPLNLETVFAALVEIERRWDWIPIDDAVAGGGDPGDRNNWEMYGPHIQQAVRTISRALQQGQKVLIKRALTLDSKAKLGFMLRIVVRELNQSDADIDDPERIDELPAKADILERLREKAHPTIVRAIPESENGITNMWENAGLKHLRRRSRW